MKYSFNAIESREGIAFAQRYEMNASYKDLCAVCDAIRYRRASDALKILENVAALKAPIEYRRHNKHMGARHELHGRKGKYPSKAAKEVRLALVNAIANALNNAMDGNEMVVIHASANKTHIERLNPSYYTIFTVIDALNMQNMMKGSASLSDKSAEDVMHRKIVYVKPNDTLEKAVRIIKDYDFPQIPVIGNGMRILGTVSQKQLLSAATEHPSSLREILVRQITGTTLPQIDKGTSLDKLKPILENFDAALVVENGKAVGIVTIYDILKLL